MPLNFYSKEEKQILLDEILSKKKQSVIAREYSKKWNRSEQGLVFKIAQIRNSINFPKAAKPTKSLLKRGRPRKTAIVNTQATVTNNGVQLPSGFVFDFQPRRAEMHSDHVRLFF